MGVQHALGLPDEYTFWERAKRAAHVARDWRVIMTYPVQFDTQYPGQFVRWKLVISILHQAVGVAHPPECRA